MSQQTIDWTRLTGKTFTTTKGAPFKVTRATAKSVTIRPESSTRSYDLSVPNELDRCVAEYAKGRFFPSAMDLVRIGVRHERNSYVWGILKAVLIDQILEQDPPTIAAKNPVSVESFVGVWRITDMSNFDADFLAEGDGPPQFKLSASKFGDINGDYAFSYSSGTISGALREFGGETLLIFGFDGSDDMDAVTGAGWAKWVAPNQITGEFLNDYGPFTATRTKAAGKAKKRSAPVADDPEEDEYEDEEDAEE
jgi:hypothetical protein